MMSSSSVAPEASSPQQLPPGFRFHPKDEELILHYLRNRAASMPCPVDIIADVDIYKFDPWDLPCKAVYGDGEWYFFSPRDRKYPNGIRPNRAAGSGYWKATGTDKPVRDTCTGENVGVKKALVFYKGRPPRGTKTDWIMHEYRLLAAGDQLGLRRPPVKFRNVSMRLDDWVLCRIYKKSGQALPTTMMVPPLADYDRLVDDDHDEHLLLAAGSGFDNIYSSNSFVYAPTSSDGTTCSVNTTTQQQQQQQPAALSKIPSISDLIIDDYALAQILDTAVPPDDDADLLHAPFAMHPSLNQLLAVGGDTSAHSSESEELIYSSSAAYYYPAAGGAAGVAKREASSPNECVVGGDGGAGNILGFGNPPPSAKRLRAAYAPPPASGLLLPPATPSSSQVLGGLNHNSMLLPQL